MPTPLTLFPDDADTIEGTGAALRAGRTTCAAVLERCFTRIEEWEPAVRAWVVIDRDGAAAQARARDAELADGKCRGPLHGIPIGVKDIIDVEGLPTAAGFAPWRDRIAAKDADVVARLRRAGAVILGKTVTTQFAWIDPPVTRNPWNLERTPGGSSSGSAAAVATGMCLGALGTQTGGSIIRPASYCGVAGFKPTYAYFSIEGVVPLAPSLDHVGPIARNVRDLSTVFLAIANPDLVHLFPDPTGEAPWPLEQIERAVAEEVWDVKPPKLVRPRGFYDRRAEPEVHEAFEVALDRWSQAGATVVDVPDEGFDFEGLLTKHRTMMAAEAAAGHEAQFSEHAGRYAPQIQSMVEEGAAVLLPRYIRDQFDWRRSYEKLTRFRDAHHLGDEDFSIVTPATVATAPDASTTGNPCFNSPWSYLGWPAVSFPVCLSAGKLPLAVQMVGPPYDDCRLLDTAAWCEDVIRRAARAGSD